MERMLPIQSSTCTRSIEERRPIAAASGGPAQRSKPAEQQKSGTEALRVLAQDKGAAGNSIAETARSVGQAVRETARRAAAQSYIY